MRQPSLFAVVALAALAGCGQDTATATLRALDPIGDVSILCLGRDQNGAFTRGLPRADCPDYEYSLNSQNNRRSHALVTQPTTGEVALVDLAVSATQAVIDFEPSQPGYSFMPVGAEPGSIVTTPGGTASFVGVGESGREGIFALPSSCIAPRQPSEPIRDIRTWPACRLPVAPGPMVMLVDPALDEDGDPATPPQVRTSCEGPYMPLESVIGSSPGATRAQCPADLAAETTPPGRRKLAVTLPSLSELWVIDAQELLDRQQGSFDECTVEERLPLRADVTDAAQVLPADLVPSDPSCAPVGLNHGPVPDSYASWPVDVALDDEQRLYIADSDAPVIHVLDVSDPCTLAPLPSLEPRSYLDPTAIVTTRKVAVSPLTALGKRYVYAVDNSASITAGMLMAFDVSPGVSDRTPIVRERSPLNPMEPPDRIALGRDVADVEFVFQDFPELVNGVGVEGVSCDPDPTLDLAAPGAEYRPALDLSTGPSPRKLRGTFAFAALHSGQVEVIDVEDLDAACRRPVNTNSGATEDLSGCSNDDPRLSTGGYALLPPANIPTVTNELSCNVVTPHRARSRGYFTNNTGAARSAGLLAFPALTLDTGRSVTTDQSDEGKDYPKLLGARRAAGEPEAVYVGPLLYSTEDTTNRLDLDPASSDRSSLLLSYREPRAFSPNEDFVTTYEGVVRQVSAALFSVDPASGLGIVNEGLNATFCGQGVQDIDLVASKGASMGVASADLPAFARRHADYVQIVSDLLDEDDPYWSDPATGGQCGLELFQGSTGGIQLSGRPLCEQFFGPIEIQSPRRDYRIVEAHEDYLLVEPRTDELLSATRSRLLSEFASCCFPGPTPFQVRAGHQWTVRGSNNGVPHDVTTDPTSLRCIQDCSPLASLQHGRAFEISCAQDCPRDDRNRPIVGLAVPGQDFACISNAPDGGVEPGERGAECIFQNLTTRFAIYRGQSASVRDMRFRWAFSDGFSPLVIGLTSVERSRSTPQSLIGFPESNQLIVSDGSARGLTFVSSRSLGTIASIF